MLKNLVVSEDLQTLGRRAAEMFVRVGNEAIERTNRFTVALSGGSTPKLLFQTLAGADFRGRIDWTKTRFFFGDERFVPPDSAQSNYGSARDNLFEPLRIAPENIFRWRTQLASAAEAALDYEKTLIDFFQTALPRFDLILLGLGADGHTASLFPETAALNETQKIVVANRVEKLQTCRLTFTFPLINNAANVVFLVSGAEKAETLKTVLEGEFEPQKLPAQAVKPRDGDLFWFADEAAARLLTR